MVTNLRVRLESATLNNALDPKLINVVKWKAKGRMATQGKPQAQRLEEEHLNGPRPDDVKIAYIGGGSRQWARKLIRDLALLPEVSGEVVLYDTMIEGAERNARFGNWVQELDKTVGDWSYRAVEDREEALEGADFVILSTQYDTRETFVHDLRIPKEYGIYGAVSATIGPGGIFRAMRTIPVYRELAHAIREQCPDAWVINYTNPVTFVTRALYEAYPDINAVGLCHEVFHGQEFLAELVEEYYDVDDVSRQEIDVNVKGVNHFTWADEATWNGRDLFELVDHHIEQQGGIRKYTPEDLEDSSGFVDNNQVTLELYDRFGLLPLAGDRHLVEYATWFLQGEMPEDLNRWGVKRTTADYRISRWSEEETNEVERYMEGDEEFTLEKSGEVFPDLLKAFTGVEETKTHVNVPNRGQMPDMPDGAVVETMANASHNDLTPLTAGSLPRQVRTQVITHVHTHETLMEAAFDEGGDVDRAFQAFLNDPQVKTLQTEQARNLFAELFQTEEKFLGDWNTENADVLAESPKYEE